MRTRSQRGFTLIEIVVVLAIMATIMGLAFSSFGSLKNSKLRADAMRMSGALRMVYGRSAVNGLRYQVSFDLDANTYSIQCSPDNVLLDPDEDERSPVDEDDDEADPFGIGVSRPTLDDCSEPLLESTKMRGAVQIDRIVTTHHTAPVDEGVHTVAYFPNGFVERTMIWLRSGETYMTLSIDPMTGRVQIYGREAEVPDDFFEVEED